MVIHQINIEAIAVSKPEHDSPVAANRDTPESPQLTPERMKTIAREIDIIQPNGRIQVSQHVVNPLQLIRLDTA